MVGPDAADGSADPGRSLLIDADLDRLGEARAWARAHATAAGFVDRALGEVELAVTEAVSNVIRHGYPPGAPGSLELHADLDADALVLRIVDRAPPFDPTQGTAPDLTEPQAGGYGLYLIETVMDEVSWQRTREGANELRLRRLRPRP